MRVLVYGGSAVFDILPRVLIEVGIGAGVGLFSSRLDVQSLIGAENISTSVSDAPFGFLSARIAKRILGFEFVATGDGLGYDFEGNDLLYYDADLRAGYTLFSRGLDWTVLVGYRLHHFEVQYDDQGGEFETKIDLSGPYLGLSITL